MYTVNTKAGKVRGIAGRMNGNTVYLGVPYAEVPIGAQRFTPPQPLKPWDGVRECNRMSPASMQLLRPGDTFAVAEEGCLTLNIFTPAKTREERLPVLFWIFGGAFKGGTNSDPEFDGEAFAKKGAVVVSINYRVTTLGFFSTKETERRTGCAVNAGLLDQIVALQWVQENIAAFGGDPDRVTIFGQSAGGVSVRMLLVSPLAKGLFSRAIVQSGGGLNEADLVRPKDEYQQLCSDCLAHVGWTEDDVFTRNAHEVTEVLEKAAHELLAGRELALFQPFVDGVTLTDVPGVSIARGEWQDVPIICGTMAGDSWMFSRKVRADVTDKACFRGFALSTGQPWARRALELGRNPIRVYFMDRTQPPKEQRSYTHGAPPFGATTPHGSEIAYLFGTLAIRGLAHTEFDYELSEQLQQYWVNFAATGDPNGVGLPAWPEYTEPERLSLHIGDEGIHAENLVQNKTEERVVTFTMEHPGMLCSLEGF